MGEVAIKKEFEKYREYKDSGVQWLGEIPKEWELLPAKRIHKSIKALNRNRLCDNVLSLTLRGVVNNNLDNPEGMVPKDYATYQIFKKDDIVFKLIDLENVRTSRVGLVHEKGIMSSAYIRLIPGNNCNSKYTYYFYYSLYKNEVFNKLGSGVRSTLGPNDLLCLPFLKPSFKQQTAIANFLDDKTTKIDLAIAQKEKMIALLKERKQILIQNAVTKGLDPTVKMKDSGVEWIGEIPEHWEVKKLRHLGKTQNGLSKGGDYFGSGHPFLTYSDVYKNRIVPHRLSGLAEASLQDRQQFSIKNGDVFFTRTSETIGDIAFASTSSKTILDATFAGFLIRFRPNSDTLYTNFSRFYFSSAVHRPFFVGQMNIVIRASLSQEHLKRMPVLIPPLGEQKQISDYLEIAVQKTKSTISLILQEVNRLKEYKSTLIDSAVTGKIKVS